MIRAEEVVEQAKAEASEFHYCIEPQYVRVYHDERGVIWSKIDPEGNDLTAANSDGVLFNYRSLFVPHGALHPLEAAQSRIAQLEKELAAAREGLQQAEAWFAEYAEGHKAKSNAAALMSDESRSYRDKADRNQMRAEYFAHLLKEPPHAV